MLKHLKAIEADAARIRRLLELADLQGRNTTIEADPAELEVVKTILSKFSTRIYVGETAQGSEK